MRCWYDDDGGRIFNVAVHRALRGVIEERREFVEFFLRQRVKLMIVTDRAATRHSHPDLNHRIRSIAVVKNKIFFRNRTPFAGRDVASIEPRCDLLIE